jgi:hypothetical protein
VEQRIGEAGQVVSTCYCKEHSRKKLVSSSGSETEEAASISRECTELNLSASQDIFSDDDEGELEYTKKVCLFSHYGFCFCLNAILDSE